MKPILYIKATCPWCHQALSFLETHGIELDIRDVNEDRESYRRMVEVSGQEKVPTLEYGEFVVADFDVDELRDELEHSPEVRRRLGFADNEDS